MIAAWTGGQTGVLAVLVGTTIAAILGDSYTTMIALQKGYVEGNPVMRYLFKKIGQPLAVFLTGVAALFIGGSLAAHDLVWGYTYFGILSGLEGATTLRNYLKLKQAKISLK